jgi:GT2 family glycosyltransferase
LVVVVDQAGSSQFDYLQEFDGRRAVLRIHDQGTGLARARNIGAAAAEAAGATIIAYTDDDCTVAPGWLGGLDSAFASAPDVALAFGTTKAAAHDHRQGTIPAYTVSKNTIHRGLVSKPNIEGMGACMAVRADAWKQIGGFDEHLGAGTPLASAEENDLSIRLLRAGFAVAEAPEAEVTHHGFRGRPEVAGLVAGYMRGSGAATAKMVRIGGLPAIHAVAKIAERWIGGRSGVEMNHLPSRRIRLWNFVDGMRAGFTLRIDSQTGKFVPPNESSEFLQHGN